MDWGALHEERRLVFKSLQLSINEDNIKMFWNYKQTKHYKLRYEVEAYKRFYMY